MFVACGSDPFSAALERMAVYLTMNEIGVRFHLGCTPHTASRWNPRDPETYTDDQRGADYVVNAGGLDNCPSTLLNDCVIAPITLCNHKKAAATFLQLSYSAGLPDSQVRAHAALGEHHLRCMATNLQILRVTSLAPDDLPDLLLQVFAVLLKGDCQPYVQSSERVAALLDGGEPEGAAT